MDSSDRRTIWRVLTGELNNFLKRTIRAVLTGQLKGKFIQKNIVDSSDWKLHNSGDN